MNTTGSEADPQAVNDAPRDQWFNAARVVDQEWVEYSVTTSKGKQVFYRIPRRTLFATIDE